jgi:hemerythrin-like domain-containing protein
VNGANENKTMIDVLIEDHREVEQLFQELESPTTEAGRRGNLATVAIAELVRHSVAEEMYLYPTTREVLSDGDQLADHEIAEHSEAEEIMKRLEPLQPGDPEFETQAQALIAAVRHHITDEEENLFPRLREACSREQLVELGNKINQAKQVAPTRPHPSASDMPPANKLLAPGAGMVDRLRDALSRRPTSPDEVR